MIDATAISHLPTTSRDKMMNDINFRWEFIVTAVAGVRAETGRKDGNQ